MAKHGGKHGKGNKRYRRAARNVQLENQPYLDQVATERQRAQEDYLRNLQAWRSSWGGFQDALGQLPPYNGNDIVSNLTSQLQGLAQLTGGGGIDTSVYGLPMGLPSPEVQSGQNMLAALGAATAGDIASNASRDAAFTTSLGREGAIANQFGQQNILQQLNDALQGYSDRELQIQRQSGPQIQAEVDRLRQQALENQLAHSQQQSDQAFSDFLAGQLSGMAQPHTGPGPSSAGPGSGGGGAGGGGGGGMTPPENFGAHHGGGAAPAGYGNGTGPFPNLEHPLARYAHGYLDWGDLNRPQRRTIRRGISQYSTTHPDVAAGLTNTLTGGQTAADITPAEWIRWYNQQY